MFPCTNAASASLLITALRRRLRCCGCAGEDDDKLFLNCDCLCLYSKHIAMQMMMNINNRNNPVDENETVKFTAPWASAPCQLLLAAAAPQAAFLHTFSVGFRQPVLNHCWTSCFLFSEVTLSLLLERCQRVVLFSLA